MRTATTRTLLTGGIALLLALAAGGAAAISPVGLVLHPSEANVAPGQTKTFSAFLCPRDSLGLPDVGEDGIPNTADDECDPVAAGWSVSPQSIGSVLPPFGPTTNFQGAALPPGSTLESGVVLASAAGQTAGAGITVVADANGGGGGGDGGGGGGDGGGGGGDGGGGDGGGGDGDGNGDGDDPPPPPPDEDGDGVTDENDKCGGTVKGAPVDPANGCAPEQLAKITIVKDSVPNDVPDFRFEGDLGTFSLDDDGEATDDPATGQLTSARTFSVPPGTYEVKEGAVPGWFLRTIVSLPAGRCAVLVDFRLTRITVGQGDNVVCTFVNWKGGNITIVKDAVPNGAQRFFFEGTLGDFTLDDDGDNTDKPETGKFPSSKTFSGRFPGTYVMREIALPGWVLTSLICKDPDGGSDTADPNDLMKAEIDLDPGENVTCTFTNEPDADGDSIPDADDVCPGTAKGAPANPVNGCAIDQLASLEIVKDALPDDPEDFTFAARAVQPDGSRPLLQGGVFSLDDDGKDVDNELLGQLPRSKMFSKLAPGKYVVVEAPVPGWDVIDSGGSATGGELVCSGIPKEQFRFNRPGADPIKTPPSIEVTLEQGDKAKCTFTNRKRATIKIVKDTRPNNSRDFVFDITPGGPLGVGADGFTLDDNGDETNDPRSRKFPSSRIFTNIPAVGTYTVSERPTPGWNVSVTCADPTGNTQATGASAAIELDPGDVITCTFVNTPGGGRGR